MSPEDAKVAEELAGVIIRPSAKLLAVMGALFGVEIQGCAGLPKDRAILEDEKGATKVIMVEKFLGTRGH